MLLGTGLAQAPCALGCFTEECSMLAFRVPDQAQADAFLGAWSGYSNGVARTPGGLAYYSVANGGSVHSAAANAALQALVHARRSSGYESIRLACWARSQVPDVAPQCHLQLAHICCPCLLVPSARCHRMRPMRHVMHPHSMQLGASATADMLCAAEHAGMITRAADRSDGAHTFSAQIRYMLGASGRSFIVGLGTNPPSHVRDPAASCPSSVQPCVGTVASSPEYSSADPNPHVLSGALVYGPDAQCASFPYHIRVVCM